MEAKLLEVNDVELTLLKSHPPQLSIVVFGSAPTLGWTNAKLIPYVYITPPSDGFFEFDFVAAPPAGIAGEMITPVVTSYVMTDIPPELKGIRVYASLNSSESTLTGSEKTVEFRVTDDLGWILELQRAVEGLNSEKGVMEGAYEYVDKVTDLIREHNVGGSVGRKIADDVDKATDRAERERGKG